MSFDTWFDKEISLRVGQSITIDMIKDIARKAKEREEKENMALREEIISLRNKISHLRKEVQLRLL